MRQLNSELKLEAAMCIHAHAICFGKVNKGARFVYYFSLKTNFYEDHSENILNSTHQEPCLILGEGACPQMAVDY